eukprot:TRINITY_DN19537_c0_g1_i1.p1 TRINITY_DN19537_c0_g1~~TRINITY_DN19537_c0_g1_i1.p1  ORF type:complete len:227 (-),score=51.96 TRINITY_DN19537_c0_g1_i1:423-1103(-)
MLRKSIMGQLFAKPSKKPKITDTDKAILSLKTQRRKLSDQRKRIVEVIDRELQIAKELVAAKKKERAVLALKKKKLNEQQLQKLDDWLLNVETLLLNIESAKQQNKIFEALRTGADAMKEIQKEVSLEDVERLQEDSEEAKQYQERVSEFLGQSLSDVDVDEVLNEFQELESQLIDQEALELPSVPVTKPLPAVEVDNLKKIEELPSPPQVQQEENVEEERVAELA